MSDDLLRLLDHLQDLHEQSHPIAHSPGFPINAVTNLYGFLVYTVKSGFDSAWKRELQEARANGRVVKEWLLDHKTELTNTLPDGIRLEIQGFDLSWLSESISREIQIRWVVDLQLSYDASGLRNWDEALEEAARHWRDSGRDAVDDHLSQDYDRVHVTKAIRPVGREGSRQLFSVRASLEQDVSVDTSIALHDAQSIADFLVTMEYVGFPPVNRKLGWYGMRVQSAKICWSVEYARDHEKTGTRSGASESTP